MIEEVVDHAGGGISQLGLKPMRRFSFLFLISVEYLEPKHVDPRMCELLVLLGKTSMKKTTFSFGHCPSHLSPPERKRFFFIDVFP